MKDILVLVRAADPYCLQAKDWQREVLLRHPEYEELSLIELDVDAQAEMAARYRYTYLPAYFVGGVRVCECPIKKERVAEVFAKAWRED